MQTVGRTRGNSTEFGMLALPIGPIVVPFWGSYLDSYKVIPKRNYYLEAQGAL